MSPKEGLAFVMRHGVVLQAARGPVPSLAEAVVGGPIRGSWWGHPKGHEIFRLADSISESDEVLVCRLVEGKVTYVHRRLWPTLVRLAARFQKGRLSKIWNEHTRTGAHRARAIAFPEWVPREVLQEARRLSMIEAEHVLAPWMSLGRARANMERFKAKLEPVPHGGQFVVVPAKVAADAGLKYGARVRGTVNGAAYRSSLMKYSGVFHLGIHKATLAAAGVASGARVTVTIELDDQPLPTDVVPRDLDKAIAARAGARAAWAKLSPAHKREHVKHVIEAKKPETRARRIAATIAALTS